MNREKLKNIGLSTLEILGSFLLVFGMYFPVAIMLKDLPAGYAWYAVISLFLGLTLTFSYYRELALTKYLVKCILQPLAMCSIITFVEILSIGSSNYKLVSGAIICIIVIGSYIWFSVE